MNKETETLKNGFCAVLVRGDDCANCYALAPVATKVAKAYGLPLVEIEAAEQNGELLRSWAIERVPTFLLLDDGEVFARCAGYQPEEILEIWVEAKLEERKDSKK